MLDALTRTTAQRRAVDWFEIEMNDYFVQMSPV